MDVTLVEYTLAAIGTDWSGTYPDDLKRIDLDDMVILEDGPGFGLSFGDSFGNRVRNAVKADLQDGNFVAAGTGTRTRTQTGVGVDRIEAVVEVEVSGGHSSQYGGIDTAAEFDQLVDDIVQVFRSDRFDPAVGDLDPATFVRVQVENQDASSRLYGDYFVSEFELRYIGERT
jgi:hypothetical protein